MAIDIQDANISVRTYNCLKRAGYTTLEEVAQAGEEKIAKVRNLGAACLEELKTVMPNYGLAFAGDDTPEPADGKLAPKGFILVHDVSDEAHYINVDSILAFSPVDESTVITFNDTPTDNKNNYITVTESFTRIIILINNARR